MVQERQLSQSLHIINTHCIPYPRSQTFRTKHGHLCLQNVQLNENINSINVGITNKHAGTKE